jgi:lipid-A-disaccharide synthase-like uncharacterized protein
MAELWQGVANYFREVFILQLDWWVALGFLAQALFSARFLVQWIASERAGRSVIPLAFWLFSVGGGTLLLVYALYRKDPVFIAAETLRSRRGERVPRTARRKAPSRDPGSSI